MTTSSLSRPAGPAPAIEPPSSFGHDTTRRWQHRYSARLRVSDSVIVFASVMLAQFVRFGDNPATSGYTAPVMTSFSVLFACLLADIVYFFADPQTRTRGAF